MPQDATEGMEAMGSPSNAPEGDTLTVEQYHALSRRGNKYRNKKCEEDGLRFDSLKERARYRVLKLRLVAGEIRALAVHPSWLLEVNGQRIARYTADFGYDTDAGAVVEDVKSTATKTTAYRIKKKLMKALHGIEIVEV